MKGVDSVALLAFLRPRGRDALVALLAFLRPRGRDALVASLALLLSLSATMTARSEEKSFVGAGTSDATKDWFVDANWSPAGVPGADDAVTISGKSVKITNAVSVASLALASKATLTVQARPLADTSPFATSQAAAMAALWANRLVVSVSGALTVPSGCTVYPYNDGLTGTPVAFEVGSADIAGSFNATGTGWMWKPLGDQEVPSGAFARTSNSESVYYYTFAFGTCNENKPSAAFNKGGAYGGYASNASRAPYGYSFAPFMPGSQSSLYSANYNTRGGGSIVILAAGAINLSGTLVATGNKNGQNAGCAGGGIWLAGSSITRTADSRVTANGDAGFNGNQGAGSGGRVCLAEGVSAADLATLASGEVPGTVVVSTLTADNVKATGGTTNDGTRKAPDGTVVQALGNGIRTKVVVQHDAAATLVAEGVTWGENQADVGEASAFAAPEFGFDSSDPSNARHAFTGYVVSNLTGEVVRKNERSVTITPVAYEGPYTLTWLTGPRQTRTALTFAGDGEGTVTAAGVAHESTCDIWTDATNDLTLAATAKTGSVFVQYASTDISGGSSESPTLTLSAATAHAVTVYFAFGHVKRTWAGASNASWDLATNWSPAGVPGTDEDAILSNATLSVGHALTLHGLTITGSSKVTFQADGWTEESTAGNLYSNAMTIAVADALAIDGTAVVTAANDAKSGKAVKFTAGSVLLGENAKITASEKGWDWFSGTDPYQRFSQGDASSGYYWTRAMGPGGDTSSSTAYNRGAGHGANGGNAGNGFGYAYGYKYAPYLPGSPNGLYGWVKDRSGPGGGTVWIVTAGLFELNGTIVTKGKARTFGTPSGGGVWLAAAGFKVGANASVAAEGGDIDTWYGSRGAGGRVSLAIGLSQDHFDWLAAGKSPSDYPAGDLTAVDSIDLVPVSVKGGYYAKDKVYGPAGTATTVTGPYGMKTVNVLSTGPLAQGVSPDYGANAFLGGSVQTFTAPEYGTDPSSELIRYRCLGYVVSNATAQVAEGEGLSVDVTVANAPMSVTWKWASAEQAVAVRKPEHGTLSLGGVAQAGDAVQWTTGAMSPVSVVPDAGYAFVCWRGNAPIGTATANPIEFAVDEPVDLTPVLREASEPTTRTWAGGTGDWYDSAKWSPAGVPGADDALVIASGTCRVGNYLGAAALTVSGGALTVMATGDTCGELVVTGDVALTGGSVTLGRAKTQKRRARFTVGGDLTLSNAAKLSVYGGPVTATDTFATGTSDITVGGTFAINGTATLSLDSDWYSGGSVKVAADAFTLAEGATVDAAEKGYMWLDSSTQPDSVGTGYDFDLGAGHGRNAWNASARNGHAYGFANAPVRPGSPSGWYGGGAVRGGGLVRIHARTMDVRGTITANANMTSSYGGSSGGGIWLTADAFSFGAAAKLLARGGPAGNSEHHYASVGSGGRIAIGYRLGTDALAQLAETGTWSRSRPRRLRTLADFRATIGNTNMTVDVSTYLRYSDQGNLPGTFVFVDNVPQGAVLRIK